MDANHKTLLTIIDKELRKVHRSLKRYRHSIGVVAEVHAGLSPDDKEGKAHFQSILEGFANCESILEDLAHDFDALTR